MITLAKRFAQIGVFFPTKRMVTWMLMKASSVTIYRSEWTALRLCDTGQLSQYVYFVWNTRISFCTVQYLYNTLHAKQSFWHPEGSNSGFFVSKLLVEFLTNDHPIFLEWIKNGGNKSCIKKLFGTSETLETMYTPNETVLIINKQSTNVFPLCELTNNLHEIQLI